MWRNWSGRRERRIGNSNPFLSSFESRRVALRPVRRLGAVLIDLRLAVRPHAAECLPEPVAAERERGDQRVQE